MTNLLETQRSESIGSSPLVTRVVQALWPYALLTLLVVVFFWDSFFAHQAQCLRHPFCDMLSSAQFFKRNMPTDEMLPLWNPFNGYGKPFIAEPIAAFFYPFNWIYVLFEPGRAFTVYCAVHLLVTGFGIYALCRQWKLHVASSLLAAISLMFSTWFIAMLEHRELVSTVAWGPLDLFMMSWLLAKTGASNFRLQNLFAFLWQRLGWIALFALLVVLQFLAGYPQMLLYNLLLVFGFAVSWAIWLRKPAALTASLAAMVLAGAIVFCLCLPQFLLTWELTQFSERSRGMNPGLDAASMHPRHLITLLLPFVYGRPGYPYEYWQETIYEFWAGTCYVGVASLSLATFSLVWFKKCTSDNAGLMRFLVIFFLGVMLFGLVMAAGQYTPVYMFFYRHVPGFDYFRWPSKFLLYLLYALSVLSAVGLQVFLTRQKSNVLVALKWFWSVVLVLLAMGFFLTRQWGDLFKWLTNGQFVFTAVHQEQAINDYLMAAIFLGAWLAVLWWLFGNRGLERWGIRAALGLTFLNLFLVSRQINFRTSDDIFKTVPDLVTRNLCQKQPYQIYSAYNHQWLYGSRDRSAFVWARNVGLHSTLEPYRMFHVFQDGLKLERGFDLYKKLNTLPVAARERLANLMNIRYFIGGEEEEKILWEGASKTPLIIERTNCLPRAYVVEDWDVIPDQAQVLETITSPTFNFRNRAVIEPIESATTPQPETPKAEKAGREPNPMDFSIRYKWNSVELEAQAAARSLLVLIDAWYPGWKALVDGKPQPIFRANYHFRGVALEPGRHKIVFTYEPRQFWVGLRVSVITALMLLLLLGVRYARSKSKNPLPREGKF